MVAIKGMEIPKGCQRCRFFRKHMFGNGLDYSYSCDLGAKDFPMPWIRQMEERASDCPLVEVEEKWIPVVNVDNSPFDNIQAKMRGSENG